MLGTVGTILLLESGGLVVWAKRLEIGPGRNAAVQATSAIHQHLQPLGAENLRQSILVSLQKTGWSDDTAPIAPLNLRTPSALEANLPAFQLHASRHATCPFLHPQCRPTARQRAAKDRSHAFTPG